MVVSHKLSKRLVTTLFVLLFSFALTLSIGCTTQNEIDGESSISSFIGVIVEENPTYYLVESEGNENSSIGDHTLVTVQKNNRQGERITESDYQVDDIVRVEYTGGVMESYPLQLSDVKSITLLDEDE